jgi:hypothetical protein
MTSELKRLDFFTRTALGLSGRIVFWIIIVLGFACCAEGAYLLIASPGIPRRDLAMAWPLLGLYAMATVILNRMMWKAKADLQVEANRREVAESVIAELQSRISELVGGDSSGSEQGESGCDECRYHYDQGVLDALEAVERTRENLDQLVHSPRQPTLRLVRTGSDKAHE